MVRFGFEVLACLASFGAGIYFKGYLVEKAKAALNKVG